jgi:alpha-glucosidase (family GH31 glycosyl hydrolase)
MPHADTLTVVHHDDTRNCYKDVHYQLVRNGIRIWSDEGEYSFTDIFTTHAYRQREATE